MISKYKIVIEQWFDGLNNSQIPGLLPLFSPDCRIKNAANPILAGKDAPKQLLSDFFNRTQSREFRVIDCADSASQVFVCWEGILVFKQGVSIGGQPLIAPLPVRYRGVERFKFDANGLIEELDIIHETASVPRLAAQQQAGELILCPPFETVEGKMHGDENHVDYTPLVERYFRAEELGAIAAVVDLCSDAVVIRNAANPPAYGKTGAYAYVESFVNRTFKRKFAVNAIAQEGDVVFAWFTGDIGFKAGTAFGPVVAETPFDVTLEGVCRFKVKDGLFIELDVYHETTTALMLAKTTQRQQAA